MSDGEVLVNKVVIDGAPATEESAAEKLPFTVRHSGVDTNEVIEPSDEIKSNEIAENDLEAEVDPYMDEAIRQGYDPEFEGEFKRSPREFVEHGKVLNTIHKQNQKIRDLEENARNQADMLKKGMDKARDEAIDSLKAERREAREEGEWDRVDAIDDDIDSLKEEEVTEAPVVEPVRANRPITQEQAAQYAKDNTWMSTDAEAQSAAIARADEYALAYPDAGGEEIIAYTDKMMRQDRPDLFSAPVKRPARMVAGQGRAPTRQANKVADKNTGTKYSDLNSQEKRQCDLYVRSTGNTAEQYCADLDMIG